MMTKRIWGTPEKPLTGYTCGYLHEYYEQMGTIRVKEDILFLKIRNQLINKYEGRINI